MVGFRHFHLKMDYPNGEISVSFLSGPENKKRALFFLRAVKHLFSRICSIIFVQNV